MSTAQHPPRPRLTLRVGVTGHRRGASLEDAVLPRVAAQVESVLGRAQAAALKVYAAHGDVLAPEPPALVATSCLASGGDQIFARAALAQGFRLDAILPFAREDYARDFDGPHKQAEFRELLDASAAVFEIADPRSEEDASEAYETAGLVMLDHADIVVAIWDGGGSRGRGGTREILDEAIRRGIPVVWINTIATRAPALWDGSDAVLLPELDAGIERAGEFERCVTRVLAPPAATEGDETDREAALRLKRFLAESEARGPWWTVAYDLLAYVAARRPFSWHRGGGSLESRLGEWDAFVGDLPDSGAAREDLKRVLLPRYLWADDVANRMGRAYRGAYVLNFALAAASVLVGLLVVFFWDSVVVKTVCAVGEFVLIALILRNTRAGAKGAWHARFLDARRLGEMLRHSRVLAPLARAGGARDGGEGDAGERWTLWYARASERELALPNARADAGYLAAVMGTTLRHEVEPQRDYHHKNYHFLHQMHHSLDHLGERIFYLTAALCLVWVAAAALYLSHLPGTGWIKSILKPILTFLGAVLPAFGAALAGIRAQGDFDASAKRSLATERQLEQIAKRLETPPASYRQACLLQHWVADAMALELGSWRVLYANRPLTIPG